MKPKIILRETEREISEVANVQFARAVDVEKKEKGRKETEKKKRGRGN